MKVECQICGALILERNLHRHQHSASCRGLLSEEEEYDKVSMAVERGVRRTRSASKARLQDGGPLQMIDRDGGRGLHLGRIARYVSYYGWDIFRIVVWAVILLLMIGVVYYFAVQSYSAALMVEEEELPNVIEGVTELGQGFSGGVASLISYMVRPTKRADYKKRQSMQADAHKPRHKPMESRNVFNGRLEPQDSINLDYINGNLREFYKQVNEVFYLQCKGVYCMESACDYKEIADHIVTKLTIINLPTWHEALGKCVTSVKEKLELTPGPKYSVDQQADAVTDIINNCNLKEALGTPWGK